MSDTSIIARIAERRGCTPPAPCGRGAGANGTDLPCDCEAMVDAERVEELLAAGEHLVWHDESGNEWDVACTHQGEAVVTYEVEQTVSAAEVLEQNQ